MRHASIVTDAAPGEVLRLLMEQNGLANRLRAELVASQSSAQCFSKRAISTRQARLGSAIQLSPAVFL